MSRVTVRQALAELVKDDLLERKPGSGTYVRPLQQPIVWDLNLTLGAYAARLRELGFTNRAEILEAGLIAAPPDHLRSALDVNPGGQVAYLLRRILINEQPAATYRSWFDASVVPGIEHSAGVAGSLSDTLEQDYGFVPVSSEQSLEVVRSTREEALQRPAVGEVAREDDLARGSCAFARRLGRDLTAAHRRGRVPQQRGQALA